jgi:hypothetical protein
MAQLGVTWESARAPEIAFAERRYAIRGRANMELHLVNPDPRYSKVRLIEPAPVGYLHVAAEVRAPMPPGPVLFSRERSQLVGALQVLVAS